METNKVAKPTCARVNINATVIAPEAKIWNLDLTPENLIDDKNKYVIERINGIAIEEGHGRGSSPNVWVMPARNIAIAPRFFS